MGKTSLQIIGCGLVLGIARCADGRQDVEIGNIIATNPDDAGQLRDGNTTLCHCQCFFVLADTAAGEPLIFVAQLVNNCFVVNRGVFLLKRL